MTTSNSDPQKLDRFKRMLQTYVSEENWQELLIQIPAFVQAQIDGRDYTAEFPALATALDASPELATAYERLYDLEHAITTNALPNIAAPANPNLHFLQTIAAHDAAPSLAQRLQSAVQSIGQQIQFQLDQALFELLAPPPTAALTRSNTVNRYDDHLAQLSPEQLPQLQMTLTLNIYRNTAETNDCLVEINVIPAGKSWPELEGTQVTVEYRQVHKTAETDAWGNASFTEMPFEGLSEMKIDVLPS